MLLLRPHCGGDALRIEFLFPLFTIFMLFSFMVVVLLLFALFIFMLFVVLLLFIVMLMLDVLFMSCSCFWHFCMIAMND